MPIEIIESGSFCTGDQNNCLLSSSTTKSRAKVPSLLVTLSRSAMSEARFLCGDKVDFGINRADKTLHIIRNPRGGFTLSGVGNAKKAIGKSVRASISITMNERFAGLRVPKHEIVEYTVLNGSIILAGYCMF